MQRKQWLLESISGKLKENSGYEGIISLDDVEKTLRFYRFTRQEFKYIIEELLKEGYIERNGQRNIIVKDSPELNNEKV